MRDEHRLFEDCLVACAALADELDKLLVDVPLDKTDGDALDETHASVAALTVEQMGELLEAGNIILYS